MKALISAFALLSFVAASTVPFAVPAQAATTHHVHKKAKKKHATAKKHHKVAKRKKAPSHMQG